MNPYKIYILRYAWRTANSAEIVMQDIHRQALEMSYYMWVITNGEHIAVVDIGFTEEMSKRRGREWICHPAQRFEQIGIDPNKVEHVIVSHMHWDHCGNYAMFPNATFYLQEKEMAFWTGKYLKYKAFNYAVEIEDIIALVKLNHDGRIAFTDGTQQILPGITVHRVGGHTAGIQITQVECGSGTAVVASDATHTYRNVRERMPTYIIHDIPQYLDGFELMSRLVKQESYILPGHDSEVMKLHPIVSEGVALLQ